MARTFHGSRDERRTERATMARRIAAANRIADTLDELAERREARHQAELERAEARRCAETDEMIGRCALPSGHDTEWHSSAPMRAEPEDGLIWIGDWE